MKYIVALAFVGILGSLAAAGFFMVRPKEGREGEAPRRKDGMARALAFRVGFSVLLFVCILLAWKMGWIHPTGIPVSQ